VSEILKFGQNSSQNIWNIYNTRYTGVKLCVGVKLLNPSGAVLSAGLSTTTPSTLLLTPPIRPMWEKHILHSSPVMWI